MSAHMLDERNKVPHGRIAMLSVLGGKTFPRSSTPRM